MAMARPSASASVRAAPYFLLSIPFLFTVAVAGAAISSVSTPGRSQRGTEEGRKEGGNYISSHKATCFLFLPFLATPPNRDVVQSLYRLFLLRRSLQAWKQTKMRDPHSLRPPSGGCRVNTRQITWHWACIHNLDPPIPSLPCLLSDGSFSSAQSIARNSSEESKPHTYLVLELDYEIASALQKKVKSVKILLSR